MSSHRLRMFMCFREQCGFFKRKQREQLNRRKRESEMLFTPEYDDVIDETGSGSSNILASGYGDGDGGEMQSSKNSVYDNQDDDVKVR